ncbi:MAG: YkgJ family cysteine cluster protein [Planctomycetes bacterium]|nr:YkgJ family cysteine cluster protein [Planctomycetota bacterium]
MRGRTHKGVTFMSDSVKQEWYAEGMSFTCTQCGNCCTGPEGYVWFHLDELKSMAEYVKMLPNEFLRKYARKVHGHYTLNENLTEHGHDCVFLKRDANGKAGCSIYPVRPTQCRTWPFWPENLRSRSGWKAGAQRCPGMTKGGLPSEGAKGTFYPIEKIRIMRDGTPH